MYRLISIWIFLWRYRLSPRSESESVGIGVLKHLYLTYHRPLFKGTEDDLLEAFKRLLPHKLDEDGEDEFKIAKDNRLPKESNSKESEEILEKYDLIG